MPMAEIIVGAIVTVLFDKLASADFMKMARSEGINVQLNNWKETFSDIQLVLADAGQKQITQRSVESWLHHLQDLAYDIDDVVDDLSTEVMRRKLKKEFQASSSTNTNTNTSKALLKFIPTCCTNLTPPKIIYGQKMRSKLDEISTKLRTLCERKNSLGLNVNVNVERSNRAYKRLEETSLVDESKVMGREEDKEVLLDKLLGNEACNQNVSIVCIVGMGGIGKTTLAQVLYNEKKVKDHFEQRAWVCVSEEFNIFNVSKAIFQAITPQMNQDFATLDLLQVALKEKLSKKKFLVVLDDVWNENYAEWELLQRPFVEGAPGSKIIVTTRNTNVASVMNSFQPYDLKVLSEEEALSLFARYALDEHNFDKHPTLKMHGEGIVKKCGRLPLALITLGRVLRTKTDDDDWEEVLNSEIWDLQDGILPALRLSYYELPSHLKQLFAYCSLFPKDHVFDKNELVLLWMAEGFLNQTNGSKSKERLGREYFEELKSRSFFQTSTTDDDQSLYIMHDLINDLATSVAGEFFFRLDDKMDAYDENESFEKFRYVSFIGQKYGAYRKFKELQRAQGLRTFLSVSLNSWPSFHLSENFLAELLPQLQFLRVLNLSKHTITEVPQSIGSLKHIRYLNFSKTGIERLPEQVSNLYNLQSLLVCGCRKLSSLPINFVKLINLRHLDISDTPMLNKMPVGIGGLAGLQTLPKVIIEGGNGFKISELKGLSVLQGRLSILGLEKVTSPVEANDAKLQQKNGLDDLVMEWSDDSRNHVIDYKVLEGLCPPRKLRKLEILFYCGLEFPSWVGDSSFDRLTQLTLRGCRRCTLLPALGHLRSLKKLFVGGMDGVKTLGFELLGTTDSFHGIAFPSLEVLEFYNMEGWERWSTRFGDNNGTSRSFPRLREVSISDCPKLVEISIDLIPSLGHLYIKGCSEEVFQSMVGVSSSIGTLKLKNIKGLAQLNEEVLEHLGAVEDLRISECDELRYLGSSMEHVREVKIQSCASLESYSCPNSVESLNILFCDSLASLTFSMMQELPSSVKTLTVAFCCNLESISDKGFGPIPLFFLEYLYISDCENLKVLVHREHLESLTSLTQMVILDCPNMDYSFPCGLWPPNLRTLTIGCLNKPMSEWGVQNYPTSLVHLTLSGQNSGVISFVANAKDVTSSSFLLPPSLTYLHIMNFMDVESVSEVIQNLPCLKELHISLCPKIKDLPETDTTDSSSLKITVDE